MNLRQKTENSTRRLKPDTNDSYEQLLIKIYKTCNLNACLITTIKPAAVIQPNIFTL